MLGSIRDVDRTEKDQLLTLYNLRTDMRKRDRLDKLYMKIDIRKSPMAKESAAKRKKAEAESVDARYLILALSASISKHSTSAPPLVPQNVSFQRFLFEPFLFPLVSFPTVSKVWETFFRASNSSSQLKRGFKRLQHL